jgi:hypothetical protein
MAKYWAVCSGYLGRLATRPKPISNQGKTSAKHPCTALGKNSIRIGYFRPGGRSVFTCTEKTKFDRINLAVDYDMSRFHGGHLNR